jgi:hypothetical protein|tara:strand:+ start:6151 stop:6876 length:726 start_codon:yes stop_codon:yes gene_type:complete
MAKVESHIVRNVLARYPRLNQTYRFDQSVGERGKSVPCDPTADGAKYELQFIMNAAQAKDLYTIMATAYSAKAAAEKGWPKALGKATEVFKKDEDGNYIAKAVLKGAYGSDTTKPPTQVDAKNSALPKDFELTTGSKVHVQISCVPYNMRDHGVSLRLRAVQVIELASRDDYSPFSSEDGYSVEDAPVTVSGFEIDETPVAPAVVDDAFEDEAPKVRASKKPPVVEDAKLDSLVSEWGELD